MPFGRSEAPVLAFCLAHPAESFIFSAFDPCHLPPKRFLLKCKALRPRKHLTINWPRPLTSSCRFRINVQFLATTFYRWLFQLGLGFVEWIRSVRYMIRSLAGLVVEKSWRTKSYILGNWYEGGERDAVFKEQTSTVYKSFLRQRQFGGCKESPGLAFGCQSKREWKI